MTHEKFIQKMMATFANCVLIARAKNQDYSGNDAFSSFTIGEYVSGVPVEGQLLYELSKKVSRVKNLLKKEAEVKTESILDSIDDLINYAAILRIYLEPEPVIQDEIPESKE